MNLLKPVRNGSVDKSLTIVIANTQLWSPWIEKRKHISLSQQETGPWTFVTSMVLGANKISPISCWVRRFAYLTHVKRRYASNHFLIVHDPISHPEFQAVVTPHARDPYAHPVLSGMWCHEFEDTELGPCGHLWYQHFAVWEKSGVSIAFWIEKRKPQLLSTTNNKSKPALIWMKLTTSWLIPCPTTIVDSSTIKDDSPNCGTIRWAVLWPEVASSPRILSNSF